MPEPLRDRDAANACRFEAGCESGHYESWFVRANDPLRPRAFWIRYTIFCPRGRPAEAVGELWSIFSDGDAGRVTAAKEVVPIGEAHFSRANLDVRIGAATLDARGLQGSASSREHRLTWDLDYEGSPAPLLLLPQDLYERGFPKAKALVALPGAVFDGTIEMDGEIQAVEGWKGSQNHNWGSRHTDSYAWGQVAGFDDAPDAFLECSTAQVKIGPLWTPPMSLVVLRVDGREHRLNSLMTALRAKGRVDLFDWRIESVSADVAVKLHISAPRDSFVGLTYLNPPGGAKTCLNSKLASCELTLELAGKPARTFRTSHRAAFEILTDRTDHGVPVVA